jgi:quinohemoprotein ethanol dehydrogenase
MIFRSDLPCQQNVPARMSLTELFLQYGSGLFLFISLFVIASVSALATYSQQQASSSADWPLVHGDLMNQRYSLLEQINRGTVKKMGGAWVTNTLLDGASTRSALVVEHGIMYFDAGNRVYALNAETGRILWSWVAPVLPSFQGVALGDGYVFVGLTDGRVVALEQETGRVVWTQPIGADPPQKGESVTGAPIYANGTVFVGLANGDWAVRGRVVALDSRTGQERWHFFPVPAPGEEGSETWQQDNDVWKIGGAGVWQPGVVDPDLGLVYFGTGNAVPPFAGELRGGDNLFTVSILALDIKTGKLRWHYQLVHHDLWEADVATPLVLYDTSVGGLPRKALAAMRGDGYLFLLDRATGRPLIPIEERDVPQDVRMKTSPTQPYPVGADRVLPDCEDWGKGRIPTGFRLGCFFTPSYYDQLNLLRPIFGMRVVPMSYSPQTGYFYTTGIAFLAWKRRTDDPYLLLDPDSTAPGLKSFGVVAAIDSRTDKIIWKKHMSSRGGGSVVTAGGLMFESEADGYFTAYDAATGAVLWKFPIGMSGGTGSNGGGRGPATVYEVNGTEYVAVPAGTRIWAFRLGGTLAPPPLNPTPESTDDFTGPIVDTDEVETVSLDQAAVPEGGHRYYIDEYRFNPVRIRVIPGTRVVWTNNGKLVHTIMAQDGSWTTGPISVAQHGAFIFNKPGRYTYICKEHPWVYGEVIVENPTVADGVYTEIQAERGHAVYNQHCSLCHGTTLAGSDQVPPLAGQSFLTRWRGKTIGDLLALMSSTMPKDHPGSLRSGDYLDLIAYLLRSNDFPQGKEELTRDSRAVRKPLSH